MSPVPDIVSIIAGGWSARSIDLAALPGTIIGVNDAAIYAPHIDIVLSMDRIWLENRWPDLSAMRLPTFVRLSAMRNIFEQIRNSWVFPFDCRHDEPELGRYRCTLNGPNSGHCALNLAYVMAPKRINLVGFDMGRSEDGRAHWFPPYPWSKPEGATCTKRYEEWESALQEGIRQCEATGIRVFRLGA